MTSRSGGGDPAGARDAAGQRTPIDVDGRGGLRPPRVSPWLVAASEIAWRSLVVAAALAVALWLFVQLRVVVIPIVVALFVASVLMPLAVRLKAHRVPDALASLAILLGALGTLFAIGWFTGPAIARQFGDLVDAVGSGIDRVLDWVAATPLGLSREDLESLGQGIVARIGQDGELAGRLLAGTRTAVEVVVGLVLSFVLLFFILKDGERFVSWTDRRLPSSQRAVLREASETAWTTMGRYVRGQAVVAAVDAFFIGLGVLIIGVPLVLPIVVLTFLGGFFPIVGATVAGLVAVLIALATGGLVDALLVLAVVVAVQQLESNLLEPLVLGRALKLHPVVVLVALTSGAVLAGIFGAFVAVPLAAIVVQVAGVLRRHRSGDRSEG